MAELRLSDVERLLEKSKIEDYYARINELWKIVGVKAISKEYPAVPGRLYGLTQIEWGVVEDTINRIKVFDNKGRGGDWLSEWASTAREYEGYGDDALKQGKYTLAGELFTLAAACYHAGELVFFTGHPTHEAKKKVMESCYTCYKKGAPYLVPPAEVIEIPFQKGVLPAYLRKPAGVKKPPCVVITAGANTIKEEMCMWRAEFLLRRGLAVFAYDGPGQGEFMVKSGPFRMETSDKAISCIFDYLQTRKDIDADRLALLGVVTGGIIALHAAASEHRAKLVIANPPAYDWPSYFNATHNLQTQLELAFMFGAKSLAENEELIKQMTLEPVIKQIDTPLLLVRAKEDHSAPYTQTLKVKEQVRCPVDLWVIENAEHFCGNMFYKVFAMESEYIKEKLS